VVQIGPKSYDGPQSPLVVEVGLSGDGESIWPFRPHPKENRNQEDLRMFARRSTWMAWVIVATAVPAGVLP